MGLGTWSKSEVEHGRNVLNSGWEGVRSGEEEFLKGAPLRQYLAASARSACPAAAFGALLGMLASRSGKNKSIGRALASGLIGGAVGFGAAVAWNSRGLTTRAIRGAAHNIQIVRDEHWMKKNFIAYA